ncbi:type II CRISPR RNA-guided endonuclease Cas9 [Mycoplasma sp. 31_09]|uniref:type II CRISPR RNA-guided endonuclease Cas9 n=2 Tax=unclassified Mycoplasma TaxID=2683645 RepID=UPI003AAE1696
MKNNFNNENFTKKEVTLGFDLGVGSVGWSVVDSKTNQIYYLGSRLFSSAQTAEERRAFRGARRLIRRRKYKNQRLVNLIWKYNDYFQFKDKSEILANNSKQQQENDIVLNLKVLALNSTIDSKQLAWILHDYLQNRGYFYENNENINIYPSEKLLEHYNKYGFYNGIIDLNDQNQIKDEQLMTDFNFSNKQWLNEIKQVLNSQDNLPEEFINEYLALFSFVREMSKGPGSLNSSSPYGVYGYDKEQKKTVQLYKNIWDKTTGKCSVFNTEYRAPKNLPSALIFNELNELTTIRSKSDLLNGWFITQVEKYNFLNGIIDYLLNLDKDTKVKKAQIDKIINKTIENSVNTFLIEHNFDGISEFEKIENIDKNEHKLKLSGLKLNKNGKIEFGDLTKLADFVQKLKQYLDIRFVSQYNLEDKLSFLDNMFLYLSHNYTYLDKTNTDNLALACKNDRIFDFIVKNQYEPLCSLFKGISEDFKNELSKTHSLSQKAITFVISKMIGIQNIPYSKEKDKGWNFEALKNYDESFKEEITKNRNGAGNNKKSSKYLNPDFIDEAILSPGVKKILREATKVFNAIKKKFGKKFEISKVVIELARELSDDDISKNKKNYEKIIKSNREIIEKHLKSLNINEVLIEDVLKSPIKSYKTLLWLQQDHNDLYSGKEILFEEIFTNTEIDHILPYSQSFDDSSSNKVLVLKKSNQLKGQKTPYEFINSGMAGITWDEYVKNCDRWYANSNEGFVNSLEKTKKYKKLLTQEEQSSFDIGFLARNLNDTRYATVVFRDALQEYSKNISNCNKSMFPVISINGGITSFIRKNMLSEKLRKKDRDDYSHHAIDASIIAMFANETKTLYHQLQNMSNYKIYKSASTGTWRKEDIKTGEITEIDSNTWKQLKIQNEISQIAREMEKNLDNIDFRVQFSRKKEIKSNMQLFNSTVYSMIKDEDEFRQINKKSLFSKKSDIDKLFNSEKENILLAQANPYLFDLIKSVYLEYESEYKNTDQGVFNKYMADLCKNYPDKFSPEFISKMINSKTVVFYDSTNDNTFRIKHLRVKGDKLKDTSGLIIVNKDSKTDLPKAYQTSINSVGLMIMKKKDNVVGKMPEYVRVPINTLNTHFNTNELDILKHDFSKDKRFMKYLKEKQIDQNYVVWRILVRGTTLIEKERRELFYISSFQTVNDVLELKYVAKLNKKISDENKEIITRIRKTTNQIINDYIILDNKNSHEAEPDILGLNKILIDKRFN